MPSRRLEAIFTKNAVVVILAVICVTFWGSAATAIKLFYSARALDNNHLPSLLYFAGFRFIITGLLILVIFSIVERKLLLPTFPRDGWRITVLAFFETFMQYVPYYIGLGRTSGTTAAIIHGCNAFTMILVAVILFRSEKMTVRKGLGCALGVAAVFLLNLSGLKQGVTMTWLGEGMLVLAQMGYVIGINFTKVYARNSDPIMLTGWQFLVGGAALAILGGAMGGSMTLQQPLALGVFSYLSIFGAVAYALWSILLKFNDVSRIAVYNFIIPICGILFSVVFLGETKQAFHPATFFALILTFVGIRVANSKQK